jgi:hypothetical protein
MTWFPDLSPCDYFGPQLATSLIAVGWLERDRPYETGKVATGVYEALVALVRNPWQPVASAGSHECDLCLFEGEPRCADTVFIPASGYLYVSPTLITHYINAHGYHPPTNFCNAVLACPPTRSMEYLKALLASGGSHLVELATADRGTAADRGNGD